MKNKIEKLIMCMISLALITSFFIVSLSMQGINTNIDDFSFSAPNLSTQDIFWPSNASEWTEVPSETQGLDSDKITAMFEFIEDGSHDIHSVIIVRNGYLLTEEYLYNSTLLENKSYFGGEPLHMLMSTTKSVMSILIGIALQEGFLDNLNQTLYEFFADIWEPSFPNSTLKKDITIEQLLTMNAGFTESSFSFYVSILLENDSIKFALNDLPLVFTPGEPGVWEYSSDGPNLLSGIITKVTGKSAEEFAKEYLFTPLGISEEEYDWWHDNKNISYGGYGLDCTPKVQAKLGMLALNNGTWNGIQIVDKDYMKDATTPQISTVWEEYGYLFSPNGPFEGYSFIGGSGGQYIYVIPKYNITVGFTGLETINPDYLLTNYIVQFAEDNAPEWDQIPEDQLIQEGDPFFYDVNASDTSGVEYSINDTTNFNITPEGIITNASSLSAGIYPLEIRAYNPFSNNITTTINIIVESIPSSNAIPGFDFNMILIMIFCTTAILIIRRKKIFRN